jgi:outer membrane protein TolC
MRVQRLKALALPLLLAACADTATLRRVSAPGAGFDTVATTTRNATGAAAVWNRDPKQLAAAEAKVRALVAGRMIGPDTAVQVALMNNRALQASFAELGLSATDLWEVARGPVPTLGVTIQGIGEVGLARTLEATITTALLEAATRKPRTRAAELDFRQAQLEATAAALALAVETRLAWIDAVAAFETAGLVRRALSTAEAASELAVSLGRTGALSRADQAREHVFTAGLAAELADARLEAQLAKERLTRLMGLWGGTVAYTVPDRLPGLPGGQPGRSDIERLALTHRVDIAARRLELTRVAAEYRLSGSTRMVSDLALAAGLELERSEGASGPETEVNRVLEVSFEIPLYDSGPLITRRAELAYLRAANNLAQTAIDARSEARAVHAAVTGKYDVARHWRDRVLPLRRTIDEESLKSYSGMLTSTFDLIADARERLEAEIGAGAAKAEYWRAEAAVTAAIWGGAPLSGEEE